MPMRSGVAKYSFRSWRKSGWNWWYTWCSWKLYLNFGSGESDAQVLAEINNRPQTPKNY